MRHGMAIGLALDMGFNLDSSSLAQTHRIPVMETKLREQIYWALYCTDKLWASYTGRVCTMLVGNLLLIAFSLLQSSPLTCLWSKESQSIGLSINGGPSSARFYK